MGKRGFKELEVWRRAKDLAVLIYKQTGTSSLRSDFGLCNQLRRSAVSIASNIAEGDERDTDRDAVRYFFIAKGSLAELRPQIQIAAESGLLHESLYRCLDGECEAVGNMIGGLIRARRPLSNLVPRASRL